MVRARWLLENWRSGSTTTKQLKFGEEVKTEELGPRQRWGKQLNLSETDSSAWRVQSEAAVSCWLLGNHRDASQTPCPTHTYPSHPGLWLTRAAADKKAQAHAPLRREPGPNPPSCGPEAPLCSDAVHKPVSLTAPSLERLKKLETSSPEENAQVSLLGTQANCEILTPNT